MQKNIELQSHLSQFNGSSRIYKIGLFGTLYTEGIRYLVHAAECHWLVTDVSVMGKSLMEKSYFVTVDFKKQKPNKPNEPVAIITYGDGNNNILEQQSYGYTDFPLDKLRLFFVNNTLMLPSEY